MNVQMRDYRRSLIFGFAWDIKGYACKQYDQVGTQIWRSNDQPWEGRIPASASALVISPAWRGCPQSLTIESMVTSLVCAELHDRRPKCFSGRR